MAVVVAVPLTVVVVVAVAVRACCCYLFLFSAFIALPIWWNCKRFQIRNSSPGHVASGQHQTNRLTAPQNRKSAVLCINLSTDLTMQKQKCDQNKKEKEADINHKLTNIAHTHAGSGSLA